MDKEPGGLQSMGLQKSDTTEKLSTRAHTHTHLHTHTRTHTCTHTHTLEKKPHHAFSPSVTHLFYDCVVQSLSCVQLFANPRTAAGQAPLSSIISWSLLTFMSVGSLTLSNHLILCCSLPRLASILNHLFYNLLFPPPVFDHTP